MSLKSGSSDERWWNWYNFSFCCFHFSLLGGGRNLDIGFPLRSACNFFCDLRTSAFCFSDRFRSAIISALDRLFATSWVAGLSDTCSVWGLLGAEMDLSGAGVNNG